MTEDLQHDGRRSSPLIRGWQRVAVQLIDFNFGVGDGQHLIVPLQAHVH
jgi:hypothetical protein